MKFILYFVSAIFIASSTSAEHVCSFQNSIRQFRGFDSSFVNVKSVLSATKIAENHMMLTILERMRTKYTSDYEESLYVMCYNEGGDVSAFFKSTVKPTCEPSQWNGSYDCKELMTITEDLRK